MHHVARLTLLAFVSGILIMPGLNLASDVSGSDETLHGASFALYVLSKDTGVPENALSLLSNLQNTLVTLAAEGKISRAKMKKIGTRGGKRLCIEFATEDAALLVWTEVRQLVNDIDQVALKSESCE